MLIDLVRKEIHLPRLSYVGNDSYLWDALRHWLMTKHGLPECLQNVAKVMKHLFLGNNYLNTIYYYI